MHLFLQILMTKNGKIHSQGLWNCIFSKKLFGISIFFVTLQPKSRKKSDKSELHASM